MLGRKVIYVRCINCSYNNVAKDIRLPDKKHFVYTGKFSCNEELLRDIPPEVKALMRLRICIGSFVPSLLDDAIITKTQIEA